MNRKGTEQPHLEQADFFTVGIEPFDGFFDRSHRRPHHDHDALSIRRTGVIEQAIASSGLSGKAIHDILNNRGAGKVERVACFAGLEENVRILRGAAEDRPVGTQRAFTMMADGLVVDHGAKVIIGELREIVQFMRGAEPVKKVQEGNPCFQCRCVGDGSQVVGFLHRARGEQRKARLASSHHVAVIAENRERVRGHRASGDVNHRGSKLASDLVHVRDHQQKSLGRGEGRAQSSGLKSAVECASRATLTLHLHDLRNGAPDILATFDHPLIGQFAHRGGRCDRINRNHFTGTVCHRSGSLVPVHDCHCLCHRRNSTLFVQTFSCYCPNWNVIVTVISTAIA